jgi:cytochrome c oxidase subunit II
MRPLLRPSPHGRLTGDTGTSRLSTVAVILWLLASTALVVILVGGAWWEHDAPLNTFNPQGENARTIQDLVEPVFIIAGIIFVGVMAAVLVLSFRRRVDPEDWEDDPDLPRQNHGDTRLEIAWTVLPALILAWIAVNTVVTIFELDDFSDTEMVVLVEGNQWWWQYQYDTNGDGEFGDIITSGELVIPAGTDVEMRITANDVIHSFWIPNLNGKRDAVPGRTTSWKMQADEPGRYRGDCTEFCGLSHARMKMYVIALPPEEYEQWEQAQLAAQPTRSEADFEDGGQFSAFDFDAYERGRSAFETQCASCHAVRNEDGDDFGPADGIAAQISGAAPDLTHLMSRETLAGATMPLYVGVQDTVAETTPVDDYLTKNGMTPHINNLEAWLRDPEAIKPMFPDPVFENFRADDPPLVGRGMPNLGLTEAQIDDLVTYLITLT